MNNIIRNWRLEDAVLLSEFLNNKKITDNLRDGLPSPYRKEDGEAFIKAMLSVKDGSQYTWAITVDDQAVGSIGIFRKDNIHNRTAELGYYVAEPYWGRGVGTRAVQAACSYIFGHTDILRIFAEPFSNNIPSCRILEKSGFVLEGILRKNAYKNGKVLDMKMYALIKETD